MGRSDSRTGPLPELCLPPERWLAPPRRVSQVPRLICPRVLSPSTPESPAAASAHFFTAGVRLHHTWKTGHLPFALTRPNRVHCRYGSRVRLPGLRRQDYSRPRPVGYLSNEQLQGKLLSAYKISQAYPGAPGLRYPCYPCSASRSLPSASIYNFETQFLIVRIYRHLLILNKFFASFGSPVLPT